MQSPPQDRKRNKSLSVAGGRGVGGDKGLSVAGGRGVGGETRVSLWHPSLAVSGICKNRLTWFLNPGEIHEKDATCISASLYEDLGPIRERERGREERKLMNTFA